MGTKVRKKNEKKGLKEKNHLLGDDSKVFLTDLHMDVQKFGMRYIIVSNSLHLRIPWKMPGQNI